MDTFQAIVFNYYVCVTCGWIMLGDFPVEADVHEKFWFPYALVLGAIFISTFNFVALTVQKFGITVGAVMQKMSLLLSVGWAIVVYSEGLGLMKAIGLIAAIGAIILTNIKEESPKGQAVKLSTFDYFFPALVLIGSGVIEILLFEVEQKASQSGDIRFISTLFGTAGVMGGLVLLFQFVTGKAKWQWQNLWGGVVLGVVNFFCVVYLMKTLGYGWDASIILPINNVAIIGLSALIAYFFLKEKLSALNWGGVVLAGLSILLIAFA